MTLAAPKITIPDHFPNIHVSDCKDSRPQFEGRIICRRRMLPDGEKISTVELPYELYYQLATEIKKLEKIQKILGDKCIAEKLQ